MYTDRLAPTPVYKMSYGIIAFLKSLNRDEAPVKCTKPKSLSLQFVPDDDLDV
jgi:hypothetical protein